MPLWCRKPCYPLPFGVCLGWIVDAKKDSVDVVGLRGCLAGSFEIGDWYFNINSADFVRTRVLRKSWYGIDFVQIVRHLLSVGCPLC